MVSTVRIDHPKTSLPAPGPLIAAHALPSSHISRWTNRIVSDFSHHVVALLLAGTLLFGLLPFLAPLFMALEWYGPGNVIYQLYSPFCHQLPQRSWFLFGDKLTYTLDEIGRVFPNKNVWELRSFVGTSEMGWKVAWSDRMISFYTMTPVFGLFYALRRWRMRKPISVRLLLVTILPVFLDGSTHMLNDLISSGVGSGFRDTNAWLALLTNQAFPGFYAGDHFGTFNWWMRLISGLVAALGVAFFFFPWLDQLFHEEVSRQVKLSKPSI